MPTTVQPTDRRLSPFRGSPDRPTLVGPAPLNVPAPAATPATRPTDTVGAAPSRSLSMSARGAMPSTLAGLTAPGGGGGVRISNSAALAPSAASAAPSSASAPTATPPYTLPADAQYVGNDTAKQVGAIIGIVFLAPLYAVFAILAAIPALIGGAIEAPKEDGAHGDGTFYKGFANVFRAIMNTAFIFVQWPMQKLVDASSGRQQPFYIDRTTDPSTAIITVRLHLTGDAGDVAAVKGLESEIEKNLAIPGYRVNVELVDHAADDATDVAIDREVWSNSGAWNPYNNDSRIDANDAHMMAHETMHVLGLPDEYCPCDHFTNPQMSGTSRFGQFWKYLFTEEPPADAETGMMANSWRAPLPRHYQAILAQA